MGFVLKLMDFTRSNFSGMSRELRRVMKYDPSNGTFTLKIMDFILNTMDFKPNIMDFILKTMDCILNNMDSIDNVEQAVDAYRDKRWEKTVESCGKIVFPKTATAKFSQKTFLVAKHKADSSDLAELVLNDGRFMLKKPRAIISVTGGATNLDLSAQMRDQLCKDLRELALLTRAFIITGATNSGCMELAGQAVHGMGIDCIGIAPLGLFYENEKLQSTAGWHRDVSNFNPKAVKPDTVSKPYCQLDQNHSHFILLDTQTAEQKRVSRTDVLKTRKFCVNNEELCIKNDQLCRAAGCLSARVSRK